MRISDNLTAESPLLELRAFRLWDLTDGQISANTLPADTDGDIVGAGSALGAAHRGLAANHPTRGPMVWDGAKWDSFARQRLEGGEYRFLDLGVDGLGRGQLITGSSPNGRGVPINRADVPLSHFGAAEADLNLGGMRITNAGAPSLPSDLATVAFVNNATAGANNIKDPVLLATDKALPSCVYNAAAGTLTGTETGAITPALIDAGNGGVGLFAGAEGIGSRILIKNQISTVQNGIYRISTFGVPGTSAFVFVRTADSNENAELANAQARVLNGTFAGTIFRQARPLADYDITAGTGTMQWVDWLVVPTFTAGVGISIASNLISVVTRNATGSGETTAGGTVGVGEVLFFRGAEIRRVTGATATGTTSRQLLQGVAAATDSGIPRWSPFTIVDPPAAAATEQRYLAQVVVPTTGLPRYERIDPPANALFFSTVVSGSDQVAAGNNVPFSFTMNNQAILTAASVVALDRGGTGRSNLDGPIGGVAFKSSASEISLTTTPPVVGMVPMVISSGVLDLVDIWARSNTWTNLNTFAHGSTVGPDAITLRSSSLPSVGGSAMSTTLRLEGKTDTGGVASFHHFGLRASGRGLQFAHSINQATAAPGAWAVAMAIIPATKAVEVFAEDLSASLTVGATTILGSSATTVSFPEPGGLVAMQNVSNVFSVTQVFEGPSDNLFVRKSGDSNPRVAVDTAATGDLGGRIRLGPGGASAMDWTLERSGAAAATVRGRLNLVTGAGGVGGLDITGVNVTGTGAWQAGAIAMQFGGTGANLSSTANLAVGNLMVRATGSVMKQMGGTPAAGAFTRHNGTEAVWSAWALPASLAIGDILIASVANNAAALARPGAGTDTHFLGIVSGLPAWRPWMGTRGTLANGTGATTGTPRSWRTLYQGTNPGSRGVVFTHPFATRDVADVKIRATNSGDTLNPSRNITTGWEVIDANSVRVYFAAPPQSTEHYVVTVIA